MQSETCDKEGETHGKDATVDQHLRASATRASETTSPESEISLGHEVRERHRFLQRAWISPEIDFS